MSKSPEELNEETEKDIEQEEEETLLEIDPKTSVVINSNTPEEQKLMLQLDDVVKIENPSDESLNGNTFVIDYIDKTKVRLIDVLNMDNVKTLKIDETGQLGNGTITKIELISRNPKPGFARQNDLVPGKWIHIHFGGEDPAIITGEITNLEEDMIEIKTYPDCETIYINFDYKGIPEDLLIENIQITTKPAGNTTCKAELDENDAENLLEVEKIVDEEENPVEVEKEKEIEKVIPEKDILEEGLDEEIIDTYLHVPEKNIKNVMTQIILKSDDFKFGTEVLGPVREFKDVDEETQRYSLDDQTNDLLDSLLSKIPHIDRTSYVLKEIHKSIERFVQLRKEFSIFDENGNVIGFKKKGSNWKPLVNELSEFKTMLYWLMPVVKNIKKLTATMELIQYNYTDVEPESEAPLMNIQRIVKRYINDSSPQEHDKYVTLWQRLNPVFTPFIEPPLENNASILIEAAPKVTMNVMVDNLDDFYSRAIGDEDGVLTVENVQYDRTRYEDGLTHMISTESTSTKIINKVEPLTKSDNMFIKSFLTLPEPVIRFSRINLPNTKLIDKSSLNMNFLQLWKIFKPERTYIENISIDNLDSQYYVLSNGNVSVNPLLVNNKEEQEKIDDYEFSFVTGIKNYSLKLIEYDETIKELNKKQIYEKFLDVIIPKTRLIFNTIKKYITGKVSIVDIVEYMEPFLVYTDDITYILYTEIVNYIDFKISSYNKNFLDNGKIYRDYSNKLKTQQTKYRNMNPSVMAIFNIFKNSGNSEIQSDEIFKKYNYDYKVNGYVLSYKNIVDSGSTSMFMTNSELLRMMIMTDYGNLYNQAIAYENIPYMFSEHVTKFLETGKNNAEKNKKNAEIENEGKCVTYIVAKKYQSEEQLKIDNGLDIYYDKEYDKTNYSILEEYEKEMLKMSPDDFLKFFIGKLKDKMKINEEKATELADIILTGFKKVNEGDIAILYNKSDFSEKYYKRQNKQWVLDETINEQLIANSLKENDGIMYFNDQTTLCIAQPDCVEVNDKCETTILDKAELLEKSYDIIMSEFDKKYQLSKEKLKEIVKNRYEYFDLIIENLEKISTYNFFKYNEQKYNLGLVGSYNEDKKEEVVVSPYYGLLNIILGETDFVKKQSYILRFVDVCTRPAINGYGLSNKEEDPHWFYCKKTNTKLIPVSLNKIASFFVYDNENFAENLEILASQIGETSDDGDYVVDKYSGYVIKRKDFDVEEGYDEGFKIVSRDILEEEKLDTVVSSAKIVQKKESPEMRMISNIISTFSSNLGINLEHQSEFIKKTVTNVIKNVMPNEKDYKKEILEASKKKRTLPSFNELYNNYLLYITMGMIVIAIQTSVPSIKTKKTFPSCSRSFVGYPIEGTGDDSAVKYIACIAYNIRTSVEPWNVLSRKKQESIVEKLKSMIDTQLWELPEVRMKVEEKLLHLSADKENDIPEEHDIKGWTQFLPPLSEFKIKGLENITPHFKSKLISDMKNGSKNQEEEIFVVETKIIQFSLALQEKIQDIINKKKMLLTSANNVPFIENACCNEMTKYSTIGYFMNENNDIKNYNSIVKELSNLLKQIHNVTEPIFLRSRENTKMKYPSLDNRSFDDQTIYRAFIVYCKFTSLIPLAEELIVVCNNKPEINLKGLSIDEQIAKLKRDNRQYTNESLLRLLQIIGRNNIVHVSMDSPQFTPVQVLRDIMKNMTNASDTEQSIKNVINHIEPTLDTYDVAIVEDTTEMRSLKNYLSEKNGSLREEILEFVRLNNGNSFSDKSLKQFNNMLKNIFNWNDNSKRNSGKLADETTYNMLNFVKTYIVYFAMVFPNIILNQINHDISVIGPTFDEITNVEGIKIPNYWRLENKHRGDISKMIENYYSRLVKFYGSKELIVVLNKIQTETKNLLLLVDNTPYFSEINYKDRKTYSIFDKSTSRLLIENYFYMLIKMYIDICSDTSIYYETSRETEISLDDVYTVEGLEQRNTRKIIETTNVEEEIYYTENSKITKTTVTKLLNTYIQIMNDHKDMVDFTYEDIMDRVFKTRENEKHIMIERLEDMTDEMRDIDNIYKMLKMGNVWGEDIGRRKYRKSTKEGEREFVNKLKKMEESFKKDGTNDRNADILLDEAVEEELNGDEIDYEVNNMEDMTEDYMDGQYNPDDMGNYTDINYGEYY